MRLVYRSSRGGAAEIGDLQLLRRPEQSFVSSPQQCAGNQRYGAKQVHVNRAEASSPQRMGSDQDKKLLM